jgi:uncharacterized glyoxalase superfamily protein PhnB
MEFHSIYVVSGREILMQQNAQLMAMIYLDLVEDDRAYYVEKIGFSHEMGMLGKDGQLDFCTVSLGGARIMLMRPAEGVTGTNATSSKRPVELYMEVADVEVYHDQLKKPTSPLTDQWWGDRTFTVQDPFG